MEHINCAYCEAGIAQEHNPQPNTAHICIECGNEVQAVDNQGRCVTCISMAQIGLIIKDIEGAK